MKNIRYCILTILYRFTIGMKVCVLFKNSLIYNQIFFSISFIIYLSFTFKTTSRYFMINPPERIFTLLHVWRTKKFRCISYVFLTLNILHFIKNCSLLHNQAYLLYSGRFTRDKYVILSECGLIIYRAT